MSDSSKHDCERELMEKAPSDGYAYDGLKWICSCGAEFEHICDESAGCCWEQIVFVEDEDD